MKLNQSITYKRIIEYLKGVLSNRERHDFESEMMRDMFDEEAFEGISSLPVEELEKDIKQLKGKVELRVKKDRNMPVFLVFKVAASIIILFGLVIAIRFSFKNEVEMPIAEKNAEKIEMPSAQINEAAPSVTVIAERKFSRQVVKKDQLAYQGSKTERVAKYESEEAIQTESNMTMQADIEQPEAAASVVFTETTKAASKQVLRARVTDSQGIPLPGVSVYEKGTSNATVTNLDGEFELKVSDDKDQLVFNNIGYQSIELPSDSLNDKEIKLEEDLLALDEVVVVGYGVEKKSAVTGAGRSVNMDDINSSSGKSNLIETREAIPPSGSFFTFKKYIYSNFDYSNFRDLKEKQKVFVEFTVYMDGSVGDFQFKQPSDKRIASEIERIIRLYGQWQPSTRENQPVDAKVKMRLVIDPSAKDQ